MESNTTKTSQTRKIDHHKTVQYVARLTPDLVARSRAVASVAPGALGTIIANYPPPSELLALRAQLHRAKNLIQPIAENASVTSKITHLLNAKLPRGNHQFRVRLSPSVAGKYQSLKPGGALALGLVLRAIELRLIPSTLRHLATNLCEIERNLATRGVVETRREYVELLRAVFQLRQS